MRIIIAEVSHFTLQEGFGGRAQAPRADMQSLPRRFGQK